MNISEMYIAHVGMRIKVKRLKAGMTVKELAKACSISKSVICEIERGAKAVRGDHLDIFANALGVDRQWLANGR